MSSNNSDHQSVKSGNISNVSSIPASSNTPSSYSSSSFIFINDSPRRSARLSSKSPQIITKSLNESNVHRIVAGTVHNSHSPKMNTRKRASFRDGRSGRRGYPNPISQIISNDNIHNFSSNSHTNISHSSLAFDQSEDEEMVLNNNNNDTTGLIKISEVASRSQILSYFEEKSDGFKCKICNKVSSLIFSIKFSHPCSYKHRSGPNLCYMYYIL